MHNFAAAPRSHEQGQFVQNSIARSELRSGGEFF
ncbi:MAG: hypothetical protein JWM99_80, partial [Verrucomicrobiales bacterium]|nr:hypothetical protein [Verrucomicrobiales bacterium]